VECRIAWSTDHFRDRGSPFPLEKEMRKGSARMLEDMRNKFDPRRLEEGLTSEEESSDEDEKGNLQVVEVEGGVEYKNGVHLPMHEKHEFEKWVREVLYGRKMKDRPMQAVKSRVMHGVSYCCVQSCTMFLLAFRADYTYHMSYPMRIATTEASLPNLLYAKACMCLVIACWGLRAWFTRNLLHHGVMKIYLLLRLVEWILNLWLLIALLRDFNSLPFEKDNGMEPGEKAIYFFGVMVCTFGLFNGVLHVGKLWIEWFNYKDYAFNENMQAKRTSQRVIPQQVYNALPHNTKLQGQDIEIELSDQLSQNTGRFFAEIVPAPAASEEHLTFLEQYAIIPLDEFLIRWDSMTTSGSFQNSVAHFPTISLLSTHLQERFFQLVFSDEVQFSTGVMTRAWVFAQSGGAVFLMEILFDVENNQIFVTFKSQDESKAEAFLRLLELDLCFQ